MYVCMYVCMYVLVCCKYMFLLQPLSAPVANCFITKFTFIDIDLLCIDLHTFTALSPCKFVCLFADFVSFCFVYSPFIIKTILIALHSDLQIIAQYKTRQDKTRQSCSGSSKKVVLRRSSQLWQQYT